MKKYKIKILIISMLMQMINITVLANSTDIKTAKESLTVANEFLEENIGYYDYFKEKNANGYSINEVLAVKGTPTFSDMPIFVYGSEEKASIDAVKKRIKVIKRPGEEGVPQYRCLGYTTEGDLFANLGFPPDYPQHRMLKLSTEDGLKILGTTNTLISNSG